MGIIENLRDTVSLIQQVDNIDLMKQMLALQTQVVALFDENRQLKERLATRATLTFKRNSYWQGEEGPYCSRCYDAEDRLIRLHIPRTKTSATCPKCQRVAIDPDSPFS